jgi:hypothetical protein
MRLKVSTAMTIFHLLGYKIYTRFENFTAVTVNNAIFCDVMPCGSCKNRRFGEICHLHHQGEENQRARNVSSN